jgi:SAM-dependent methyltransferase
MAHLANRTKQLAASALRVVGLEHVARKGWNRLRGYQGRLASEQEHFDDMVDVHALPAIFHYWSHKYLLPKARSMGYDHPDGLFANGIADCLRKSKREVPRILSIGAGNCDTEARVAKRLLAMGFEQFEIECLELSKPMLARGVANAQKEGVAGHIRTTRGDFNRWKATQLYDAIIANQSLHHVVELERLYDEVKASLEPWGAFIVSDMIGRNGHMRWPEALAIVDEFWRELPNDKRYNRQLRRQEDQFVNWDCSSEGFEGIRAQDVLPLLMERFEFHSFLGFSNVVDPFIDRGFGHNYDPDSPADRAIIDRVHERDESEIRAGRVKPTHMFAVMSRQAPGPVRCIDHLTPQFCVRQV